MPRVLARLPYGAKTNPVEAFDFEEDTERRRPPQVCLDERRLRHGGEHHPLVQAVRLVLAHPRRRVGRRGRRTCRCTPSRPTTAASAMKCPTEIAIDDRREEELAKLGLMPLLHRKNTDIAAFIGAQSLQKPAEYDDPDATANANLSARLPYLFAVCRFAHYLKCDRPRQDRLLQGARGHAEVAAQLDHQLRRRQSRTPRREDDQGAAAACARPRCWSRRSRATRATTMPASICGRTTSSRA